MSEIDKLLAQLKAEYENPAPSKTSAGETSAPKTSIKHQSQPSSPLDSLLSEIKAEFDTQENPPKQQPISETSQQSSSVTPPLPKLEDQFFREREKPTPEIPKRSPTAGKMENSVLRDLQTEFQESDRAEVQRQKVQLKEQQRLEEQRQQQRRQALKEEAQDWLKHLNSKSEEGRWFEEFAYSYESKLEAAIDYLKALRESGLK